MVQQLKLWASMLSVALMAWCGTSIAAAEEVVDFERAVYEALPDRPYVKPRRDRRLLVYVDYKSYGHDSTASIARALEILGEKTGAFEAVISSDMEVFNSSDLRQFDAVCFVNTTGDLFLPKNIHDLTREEQLPHRIYAAELKYSLQSFIKKGKGLVGIHAALDAFPEWPDYSRMFGANFDGNIWQEKVYLKVENQEEPINWAFKADRFEIADAIYQLGEVYDRSNVRVLTSLDIDRVDMTKPGIHRTDGDFATSWIKRHGVGRVFYCGIGHRAENFTKRKVLLHYLAGIQFALGDYPQKIVPQGMKKWTPLYNGTDLSGWKGLVGDPKSRALMSADELKAAQVKADERMRMHWKASGNVLSFDGEGDNICTVKDYDNFELMLDWRIQAGGDSGIYLRGSPQVQIWDPAQWPEGSGGLYNNVHQPSKPTFRADNPIGNWNNFRIRMVDEMVSVYLNGLRVVDNVVLENYWERDKSIYGSGPIELQAHNSTLEFKDVMVREIDAAEAERVRKLSGWRELFNGKDLTGWSCKDGSWVVDEGTLAWKGGSYIWTKEQFENFILEFEFKLDKDTNSGLFFRTSDLNDVVQTGIEMQILDSFGKETVGKHDCGAIYDCVAPQVNAVRAPGEWNHAVLMCRDSAITVFMNGERVLVMDLDKWTEPQKNPDGSANKFKTAYKDMKRKGYIGFQDHGKPVWYRNIRIKPLD